MRKFHVSLLLLAFATSVVAQADLAQQLNMVRTGMVAG